MPEAAPFTPEIVGWRSIRSSRGLQQPGRDDGQPLAFSLEETEEGQPFRLEDTDEAKPFTLDDTEEGRIGGVEQFVNAFGQRVAGAGITAAELLASGGPEPLTSDQMDRDLQMAQERRQMAQGWREYANKELYPLPEPKNVSDYVARIGGGLAFDIPAIGAGAAATGSLAAGFGLSTLASTGDPVAAAESAAMGQALKYLNALPLSPGTKMLVESGGMYGYTYARTKDPIEAAINGLLPVALHGKDLLASRRQAMRTELEAVKDDPQKTAEVITKFAEEAPTADRVNRLTPEAAAKFVAEDEMAARAFADLEETPSRPDFKKAGFDGRLSQADRDAFRRMVQQEVARRDAASQEPAQAATEQRTQQAVDQLNAEEAPPAPDAAEVAKLNELAARPAETSTPGNLEASNEKEVQAQGRPEGLLTGTTEGTASPAPAPNTAQATSDMTWTELKARAKELGVPVRGNRSAVAEAVAKAESSKKLGKVIWAQEPTRRELAGQGSTIGANKPQAQEQAQAKMDLSGFGASAEPKQLKNIENALSRNVTNRGRVISRKSLVEEKIGSGATVVQSPKGLRRLMSQDGSFLDESQISKTAMDYAEHLLSTKPTFSKPQSTPSDVRPGEAYQRELRRLKLSDPPANTRQRNRLNAELKVNKTLDDLRKAYLAARSSEGRAMKAEARQEAQDAPLTLGTAIYKPVHELPADAAESIQFRAKQILADNPAERTRKALEKIVKDKGSDVGGDVEAQKQRIIDELMGNKEIYPGIRVPDPDPAIERIAEGTDFAFGANMVPTAEKTTNLFGERTYEQLTGEQRGFEFGSNLAGEQPTPQGWKTQKGTIRAETDAVADAAMAAENAQSGQGTFSEAEAAQRRVDRGKDALGIVAGGGKRRADAIPGAIQVPDPAVEARLQAARGMTKKSLAQKIAEAAKTIPGKFRAQEFLPNTPENASANEFFRLIKNTPTAAVDETVRTIGAIMDTLGNTNQQILFERKLHIQNQLAALDRGEPLRHGWKDRAQVEQYNQQLDSLIAQSPEVQQAIQTRTKVVQELANNLAAEGLISKQAAARAEQYFHQQVLMKAELDRVTRGGSTARPVMRSFQKNRVKGEDLPVLGAEYDYNTRYIEAEAEWMIHAQMELRKAQLFKQFIEPRNQMGVFTERAKATGEDVAKIARAAGYDLWQPRPGNVFYRATSIPEQIAELIHQRILTEADITEDMLRTVLAIGGKKKTLALPKQIVQQLEASVKPKPDTGAAWLASEAMKTWKAYILTNPKNALGYNLRNATGDLDPVLGGAPGALKKVPAAADELRKYFIRQDASLSPTLRKARDLGVLDASYSATEIPDLRDVAILKRFYAAESGPKTVPGKLFDAYYGTLQKYTKFREGILRYASFLHYRERLANGTLKHYGASTKSVIDALVREQGVDVAAAKLSRELLGDYGNRTVFGNYMRAKVAPFYSWMEVNMTRWPRMAMNAVEYGRLQSGTRAGKIAFGALAGLALGSMTAAMYTYNRLMHPEAENELSAVDRNSPHLTLGKADDGTIILLRNTGALGDFLEWFGINSLANLLPKYMNDQITVGEIVAEMAKSPVNKVVEGVRPDAKAAVETITGKSLYPDAFNPRTADRGDTVAGLLNLKDEYRQAKGLVTGDGSRARPNYLQRFIGASEPKVNALQEIYDLRDAYLRQQGKPVVDRGGGAATLFTNMRRAAEAEDPKAFADAKAAYLASGKKIDNFKKSLAQLDPIAARLTDVDERRFQFRFLNNEQRAKLKTARAYAAELRKRMAKYWAQSRQSP